jgi:hypothetical protein
MVEATISPSFDLDGYYTQKVPESSKMLDFDEP